MVEQKNTYYILIGVLILFVVFIGMVSLNLFNDVTSKEQIINDNNIKITSLQIDLNNTKIELTNTVNTLNETSSGLATANNKIVELNTTTANLTTEKDNLYVQLIDKNSLLNTKITEFTALNQILNDTNSKYVVLKSAQTDLNNKAGQLYDDFQNCYWSVKCDIDNNACQTQFGSNIDINITVMQRRNDCNTISAQDLNVFKRYFD